MRTGSLVYFLPFKGITRSVWEASKECVLLPFSLRLFWHVVKYKQSDLPCLLFSETAFIYVGTEGTFFYFLEILHFLLLLLFYIFYIWILQLLLVLCPNWMLSQIYYTRRQVTLPSHHPLTVCLRCLQFAFFGCWCKLVVWFTCYLPGFVLASLAEKRNRLIIVALYRYEKI